MKVAIRGSCIGQNIVNVLYYGQNDGSSFSSYPTGEVADLGDALSESLVVPYVACLPEEYTLTDFLITTVDEHGVTNSPVDFIEPVGALGIQGGALVGAMLCAVLPFTTLPAPGASTNLKRSYLAFGPLPETFLDDDQGISDAAAALIADVLLVLGAPVSGGISDYRPVRIGRTAPSAPTRVGRVTGISLREFGSVRRSRMKNPRGT